LRRSSTAEHGRSREERKEREKVREREREKERESTLSALDARKLLFAS
jgi:hypothetical protein